MMADILKKMKKRFRRDNAGAALIMVIIAIAFVGMLVSMVVYMSYGNYLMKANDKKGKDNFYSAERVLSVINGHLQEESSKSMMNAYSNALQSATVAGATQLANYQIGYIDALYNVLVDPGAGGAGHWSLATLRGYASAEGIDLAASPGVYGAYIGVKAGADNLLVKEEQKSVTIENLRIVYTDKQGYVSIIETDILLRTPDISFAAESKPLAISDFSLVANRNLYVDTGYALLSGTDDVEISGDVYAGLDGLQVGNSSTAKFVSADPTNTDLAYNLIAGDLNVYNTVGNSKYLQVDDVYTTYVKNVKVDSGDIRLDGTVNVGDDLEVSGRDSKVTLKGSYIGYGDSNNTTDSSSSILINGANTALDFSDLEKLVLSGYAFIGATKYDANSTRYDAVYGAGKSNDSDLIEDVDDYQKFLEDNNITIPVIDPVTGELVTEVTNPEHKDTTLANSADPMMGEAMAAKAEQMIYMVPSECIGYLNDPATMSTANGVTVPTVQVMGKNPMTAEEYDTLTKSLKSGKSWDEYKAIDAQVDADTTVPATQKDAKKKELKEAWVKENRYYIPVDLNILTRKMANLPANFLSNESYKAVYRRINGTVLVYLYIDFGSDVSRANTFYKSYYEYDPVNLERYITSYIDKDNFKWNNHLFDTVDYEEDANLITNSNLFYYNNRGDLKLKENTASGSASKLSKIYNYRSSNSRSYDGLLYLLDAAKVPSNAQKNLSLFENIVNVPRLEDADFNLKAGGINTVPGEPIGVTRIGDYTYSSATPDVRVIIAGGDIIIRSDFTGLAVAGGNIIVASGCNVINADKTTVDLVLKQKSDAAGKELKALFRDAETGDDAGIDNGRESDKNKVVLSDYITYLNWQKE